MWMTAPWFRYALAGLAVTALVTIVLGYSYRKGYQASDQKWRVKEARTEQAQAEYALAQSIKINKALALSHKRNAVIAEGLSEVSTNLHDCNTPEWLQQHNDAVRIANTTR